jgi:general secretion pathway protein D
MRIIALIFVYFSILSSAFGAETKIKTIILQGKPIYFIYIMGLDSEKQALEKKQQLAPNLKDIPLQIQIETKNQFTLKIGPIREYEKAKQLKNQFSQSSPISLPQSIPTPTSSIADITPAPLLLSDKKLWNLSNADIRAVIAEVSRTTGKNFIIDPRVQGKISIISATPLSNQALYQVFLSILQISGYAAVPSGDAIKIVPNMDAKSMAPDMLNQLRHPPQGAEIMTSVVPVHYVPADQLVPVLRPLMPQWSFVTAYPPANMLILSGAAENIKQLTRIIKQVDTSASHDIDVIQLHHALAMDVVSTLKDLVKPSGPNSTQSPPTLAVDDRNNAILVSGNRTDRLRLRLIINKLDQSSSSSTSNHTQVVYLHYLRAEDLVPILAGVAQANFSGTVGTTIGTITRPVLDSTNPASSLVGENPYSPGSQPPVPPTAPTVANSAATPNTTAGASQNEGTTKPTVQIIAEPNTNSVIINGPSSIIQIIKAVICQLDIKPAQLLIEAMVAEIDETNLTNLGIEWGSLAQTGKVDGFRPGFAIINSKTNIQDLQAQVYALQRDHKANVLSTPSVIVLDNRQAKILVGKQVSVASTSYPNNANGTTTSGSPYVTFNRVNVALHLYVRPQVTRGEGIQLQIDQGNDTIDPTATVASGQDNPTFNISSIVTSVHIESGDIVVLGGLTEDSLGNDDQSIPILKDIPGIGRLFQRNLRNREKRVLMVFIRPIILHTEADTLFVSGQKYNSTRHEERKIVRSQETFIQSDQQTILRPLSQAKLPTPFMKALPFDTK